jgi:hypothetical protein
MYPRVIFDIRCEHRFNVYKNLYQKNKGMGCKMEENDQVNRVKKTCRGGGVPKFSGDTMIVSEGTGVGISSSLTCTMHTTQITGS